MRFIPEIPLRFDNLNIRDDPRRFAGELWISEWGELAADSVCFFAMSSRGRKQTQAPALTETGVIRALPIDIESPLFAGSLPMLFACVRERKVDLLGVPLAPICEAYLKYLVESAEFDLDEAAAALAALAWLLERKAWMLLPVEEEPEDAELTMELPDPTAHEFADAIESLSAWEQERARLFFRPSEAAPNAYELPFDLGEVTTDDLARALERVLLRAQPEPPEVLSAPRRSISQEMGRVFAALRPEWSSLETLIEEPFTRTDVVYWFLALLELIRIGQAVVRLYDGDVQFARAR